MRFNLLYFFSLLIPFACFSQAKPRNKKIIFKEFNGESVNGDWRKQYGFEYQPECDWNNWYFEVNKSYGKMHMDGGNDKCKGAGNNQLVVRFDKTINPRKPYTIECDFIIDTTFVNAINSFCINYNVQKGMSKNEPVNAWSVNLDINNRKTGAYTIKNMGFADFKNDQDNLELGRFTELLPQHRGLGAFVSPYSNRFKIEVNRRIDGSPELKWVTVTRSDRNGIRDRFEVNYEQFPYQPDFSKPVIIGLNTHGTNWIIKNLEVYY